MESIVRHTYDAALKLQAPGSANITTTTASSQVDIQKITKSVRGALAGRFGEGSFDVVFHVGALDRTTGDETYVLTANTYDLNGVNPVTHFTRNVLIGDLGTTLTFKSDVKTLGLEDPAAVFFGLNLTLAGTTPILGYWAFVAPNLSN
jgi:hypothetical protein